jgi:nitroimidazol reductase NimA-like FMN-containing flavoprotein (pyridoxamine 5'-phosphate oxidase superfamily)
MTLDDQSRSPEHEGRMRTLRPDECRDLLTTTTVARIAFVDADGLQLIPLNFAVIEGEIYFRTSPASVLETLADGNDEVVLGVDYHSESYREAWNVTVKGSTTRVTDPDLHHQVMSWSRLRPWAGGERAVVVHLTQRDVQGRRVHGG